MCGKETELCAHDLLTIINIQAQNIMSKVSTTGTIRFANNLAVFACFISYEK